MVDTSLASQTHMHAEVGLAHEIVDAHAHIRSFKNPGKLSSHAQALST